MYIAGIVVSQRSLSACMCFSSRSTIAPRGAKEIILPTLCYGNFKVDNRLSLIRTSCAKNTGFPCPIRLI